MVYLYHERQVAALCGQHCLNNLLQGPYFTEWDLAEIAQGLDAEESALLDASERRNYQSANVDEAGNFSIQVLNLALQRSHDLSLEDCRRPENRNYMHRPETQHGFVLNRSAHWYCMRKIDGTWWECNSSHPAPARLSEHGLAAQLAQLVADKWTIFMVKGTMPKPMSKHDGAGDPKNWVDPANPPPDENSPFGNAAPKKEEPKFQAFTGSGNRLGGEKPGSGGGGGSAAVAAAPAQPDPTANMSEDEQLAYALSLSAGAANQARLETRLPPEPESGGTRIAVRMPDGSRKQRKFPSDVPLQSLVDYVCIELAASGATSKTNKWKLVSQYPPISLAFSPDATAEVSSVADVAKNFETAGLAPAAQLNVAALLL